MIVRTADLFWLRPVAMVLCLYSSCFEAVLCGI